MMLTSLLGRIDNVRGTHLQMAQGSPQLVVQGVVAHYLKGSRLLQDLRLAEPEIMNE